MTFEMRPHKLQRCPVPGCDWVIEVSWFVGDEFTTVDMEDDVRNMKIEMHVATHTPKERMIFT